MSTTLTSKGQVTIPKQIRDARKLEPGCAVDFAVNREGNWSFRRSRGGLASSPTASRRSAARPMSSGAPTI